MHPKFVGSQTSSFFKKAVIPDHTETNWGCISLVKATLLLLKNALKNPDNRYFILVSDTCFPLYTLRDLYAHIKRVN